MQLGNPTQGKQHQMGFDRKKPISNVYSTTNSQAFHNVHCNRISQTAFAV